MLSLAHNKAAASGDIGYHPTCSQINLTHLSFADDVMGFTDGEPRSLQSIFSVLHEFERWSGLARSPSKSAIYMGGKVHQGFIDEVNRLNLSIDTLPIRYLDLPLTTKSMTRDDYEPLIDKIRSKFLLWSSRALSYAGRLQLINSVIVSITNF